MASDEVPPPAAAEGAVPQPEEQSSSPSAAGPQPDTRASLKFYHALGFASNASGGTGGGFQGRRVCDHISDDSIVYLTGKHVAVFFYETLQHRFILKGQKTSRIVAFCVSSNRRYIALSEVLHPEPSGGIQVSVYNFNTASKVRELGRARFNCGADEGQQPPVVAMDFSRDNKFLATVTDPPNPCIYLWQLDKLRLAGMVEVHQKVGQITVSPYAHWVLCTTGMSCHLKVWRAQGSQLKPTDPLQDKKTDYRFTCHQWFDDDRVVAGTADGDILIVDGSEVKRTIPKALAGAGIWCLFCVGRGFVCGGDRGLVALYERTYDSQHFQMYRAVQAPDHVTGSKRGAAGGSPRVIDVSINPSENSVICCFENNEISHFNLSRIDDLPNKAAEDLSGPQPPPSSALEQQGPKTGSSTAVHTQGPFRRLSIGFHQDQVTGVDVCVQKSILVTASTDQHVRVWNFAKKRIEIDYDAGEKVYSVACHPSGSLLAVGFQRQLSIFVVLSDGLHRCHELSSLKQCREVRFSHGGQYFACVANPPYVRIMVFDAYTFLPLGHRESPSGIALTGHSASVQSISWSRNDHTLYSAGFEGALYEWKVHKGKRNEQNEWSTKSTNFSCVRYDDETSMVVALGSHKQGMPTSGEAADGLVEGEVTLITCKIKNDAGKTPKRTRKALCDTPLRIPPKPAHQEAGRQGHKISNVRACQIAVSNLAQTLFVGTSDGRLLLFEWPPCGPHGGGSECSCGKPKPKPPEPYSQLEVHQGEVLYVVLSVDERHLFTIGAEDHCLFMMEVDTVADGRAVSRKIFPYSAFEGVSFVLQQDLDDKSRVISELRSHNEELVRQQAQEQAALEEEHRTAMRCIQEEARKEIEQAERDRDCAQHAAEAEKKKAVDEEDERTNSHMKASEELEALYTRRAAEMDQRYRTLEAEKNSFLIRYENKLHKKQAERQATLRRLDLHRKAREQHFGHFIEELQQERRQSGKDMDGMIDFTIQDCIEELDALETEHAQSIHEQTAQIASIRSEYTLIGTKESKHLKEAEALQEVIEQTKGEYRDLDEKGRALQTSTDKLKNEIAQRNEDISAREKQILELKKNTAELEKLRYVLTFKFGELRKEVAPKEEKIKDMNDRIQEMDYELEHIGMERDRLRQHLLGRGSCTQMLLQRLDRRNRLLDDKERQIQQLLHKLTNIVAGLEPDGRAAGDDSTYVVISGVRPPQSVSDPHGEASAEVVRKLLSDLGVDVAPHTSAAGQPVERLAEGEVLVRLKNPQAAQTLDAEFAQKAPVRNGAELSLRPQTEAERLWGRLSATVQQYASRYEGGIAVEQERERVREFERQRDFMNTQLSTMQQMNRRSEQSLRYDNQRKTEENAALVREINELRQTKRQLHLRFTQAESQLKEARAQLVRLQTTAGGLPSRPASSAAKPRLPPPPPPQPQQPQQPLGARPSSAPAAHGPREFSPGPRAVLGRGPAQTKGRLIKGSTRSLRDLSAMDTESIGEIIRQVERTNLAIGAQTDEIKVLRDFVKVLLSRAEGAALSQDQHGGSGLPPPRQVASAGASRLPRVPPPRPCSAAL